MAVDYRGIDLKLNDNFDVLLNAQDDFVTVSNEDNVKQALLQKLITATGDLALHPLYGSKLVLMIGEGSTNNILSRARTTAIEALLQDARVSRVQTISASFGDLTRQSIVINASVILTGSTTPLNLVYNLFL